MRKQPLVWAHRGASAALGENTLPAFEKALSIGADGFEIDVQFSRDHEIVVIHDETLDRVTDGHGAVANHTYKELSTLNAAAHRPELEPCRIPRLEEVLDLIQDNDKMINIELKNSVNPYPGLEEAVHELVTKRGLKKRILYSSFNHVSMAKMKQMDPEARTALLYGAPLYEPWHYARTASAEALHPSYPNLRLPHYMDRCREFGVAVNVWTPDRVEDLKMLIDLGVDGLITDYPDVALNLLGRA